MTEPVKIEPTVKRQLLERISDLSEPLKPIPTGYADHIEKLSDIKSVIFDVYGTLLISASGDLGVTQKTDNESAFRESLSSAGISHYLKQAYINGSDLLLSRIQEYHDKHKVTGEDHPEVDIREIWAEVFENLSQSTLIKDEITNHQLLRVAIEYECRINPTWPMPGLAKILRHLFQHNFILGIVSNAQFYTPLLFETYLGQELTDLGFQDDLCFWSFEQRIAKPSVDFYKILKERLKTDYDIESSEVLYIGNDILNDIMPASKLGFHTALFAGDKRSLRLRLENGQCKGVKPDIIINRLMQLTECV
jgi:putative hydrolase of the HAD superfamily